MGTNAVRAVYLVDPKGIIKLIIYYHQEIGRSVVEVLKALNTLQLSDKTGVAMPENWPNNHWLGDRVIVPPAATEEQIQVHEEQAKKGEVNMKDWWFAYKDLK